MDEQTVWVRLRENLSAAKEALDRHDCYTLRLLAGQEALLIDELRILWRTKELT